MRWGRILLPRKGNMERKEFAKIMQEVLDSLPEEFRDRIRNVAKRLPVRPIMNSIRPAKETPSRALPWSAHDQEERVRSANRAGLGTRRPAPVRESREFRDLAHRENQSSADSALRADDR